MAVALEEPVLVGVFDIDAEREPEGEPEEDLLGKEEALLLVEMELLAE